MSPRLSAPCAVGPGAAWVRQNGRVNIVPEPIELSTGDRQQLTNLVGSAFERARLSGKPGWPTMTAAVLKNRLIDATNGEFDERSYGVQRFTELLAALPELVELDLSARPAQVRLISESDLQSKDSEDPGRIRDDLWRAVFDYSSGGAYVWSGDAAVWVEEINPGDLVLPTMSADELSALRLRFAASADASDVSAWAERGLGTSALPTSMRRPWNSLLKKHAWERLSAWFDEHDLQVPTGALMESRATRKSEETERLRRYLQRCVAVMTADELASVAIPLAVASRVAR